MLSDASLLREDDSAALPLLPIRFAGRLGGIMPQLQLLVRQFLEEPRPEEPRRRLVFGNTVCLLDGGVPF